jgi:hypothetical protein
VIAIILISSSHCTDAACRTLLIMNLKIDSNNIRAIVLLFVTLSRQQDSFSVHFSFININVIIHFIHTEIVIMGFPNV